MGERTLAGTVALVAGATRGAGRGVAIELGAAGATVYCTGRSTRERSSPWLRPECIEETAELAAAAGGNAIPVQVDHLQTSEVRDLIARIDTEQHGRLDIVVNNIWSADGAVDDWRARFWEHDLEAGLRTLHNAVDTHITTAWHAAPLLIKGERGLIVGITDGQPDEFHDHLFYDLPKKSVMRLAVAYAEEMGRFGVTGMAISPGFLRSEFQMGELTEDNWYEAYWRNPEPDAWHWLTSESPRYTGRAIVALANDPEVARWNGKTVYTCHLAQEYGFTDLNGTQPGIGVYSPEYLATHEPRREDYTGTKRDQ